MILKTERLTIRHFTMADCEMAEEYLSDSRTMRFVEPPYDRRRTRSFVFRQCGDKPAVYPMLLRESGELIGHVIFHEYDHPQVYELGWVLGSRYWRQGYAEEAGRALISLAFEKMGLHRLFAETLEENEACRALLEKLGFEREGVLRSAARGPYGWEDLYLYGAVNSQ